MQRDARGAHHANGLHVVERESEQALAGECHGRLSELRLLVAFRCLEPAPEPLRGGQARIGSTIDRKRSVEGVARRHARHTLAIATSRRGGRRGGEE